MILHVMFYVNGVLPLFISQGELDTRVQKTSSCSRVELLSESCLGASAMGTAKPEEVSPSLMQVSLGIWYFDGSSNRIRGPS